MSGALDDTDRIGSLHLFDMLQSGVLVFASGLGFEMKGKGQAGQKRVMVELTIAECYFALYSAEYFTRNTAKFDDEADLEAYAERLGVGEDVILDAIEKTRRDTESVPYTLPTKMRRVLRKTRFGRHLLMAYDEEMKGFYDG